MDLSKDKDPVVHEKMKKNLVYVSIFSIVMFFTALSSAYIVLMGDAIWIKVSLPKAFWWSTTCIMLSSISFIVAIICAKKDKLIFLKSLMAATFLFGCFFVYFQFQGFNQLRAKGIYGTSMIMVSNGRYGDPFEVKIKDQLVEVKNNKFTMNNKTLDNRDLKIFKSFLKNFIPSKSNPTGQKITNFPSDIQLLYKKEPLIYKKQTLFINDSTQMGPADFLSLRILAQNVQVGRVDLVPLGEIGNDFKIWYKGEELIMSKRKLQRKSGKPLSSYELNEAERSRDNASGFLFILAYAHLAHIFVALLYLLKIVIRTFRNTYNSTNHLSLRLTSIFWHFLGLLWGYLILFLVFIH